MWKVQGSMQDFTSSHTNDKEGKGEAAKYYCCYFMVSDSPPPSISFIFKTYIWLFMLIKTSPLFIFNTKSKYIKCVNLNWLYVLEVY